MISARCFGSAIPPKGIVFSGDRLLRIRDIGVERFLVPHDAGVTDRCGRAG
jgi:hypothetical protein